MRGAAGGEGGKSGLGCGVLSLTEGGAVLRALKILAVEVDDCLEARRVVRTFPNAGVGGEIEAAPLRQLLKLVLVHRRLFCASAMKKNGKFERGER